MKIPRLVIELLSFVCIFWLCSCESEKRNPVDLSNLPDTVSFQKDIIPIFQGVCIHCHNGSTPPDLTQENAYIEITGGGYVNTDEPENSTLYKAIITGGPMSQYANDLDRAYILKWIQQGANEN
jgi:hypothetical protein